MQTMADVLQLPIEVSESPQACALGTAICASVAAGIYPDILQAQKRMAAGIGKIYNRNRIMRNITKSVMHSITNWGAARSSFSNNT